MTAGLRTQVPVAAVVGLLAAVPAALGGSPYLLSLATTMLVYVGYAVGFNLLLGGTDQLFLCVGALAGVAGYASTILADDRGWPLTLAMGTGVVLATALGALFSWVAARRQLQTMFVGIVTLAFSLVFTNVAQGLRDLTGGETGRVVTAAGPLLRRGPVTYYVLLAVVAGFLVAYRALERSRTGWAFRALRDDPVAAELTGVDVAGHRVLAGSLGTAMIAIMGTLFAHHEGFIGPASYGFVHVDVRVLVIVALGGVGSWPAPVVGAVVITVADELLRDLGQLRSTFYGALLILLFLGLRRGLVPAAREAFLRGVAAARRQRGMASRRP